MKIINGGILVVGDLGGEGVFEMWLVYYFSEVVCKWVFQCWFKHSDFGRVGVIDVDYKDIPEDMRMALDSPFFEIDMLKYCSERDLVILERYV